MNRNEGEAREEAWTERARRFTQHALYHFDSYDPLGDLTAAEACMRISYGELDPAELDNGDIDVPGDEEYECPAVGTLLNRDCGYRAY